MSILTGQVLRDQLSVIMARLSQAAMMEICELVEGALVGLRTENQQLKSRLDLIEAVVVRGSLGGKEVEQSEPDGGGGEASGAAQISGEELPDVVLIKDEDSDILKVEHVTPSSTTRPKKRHRARDKDPERKVSSDEGQGGVTVYSLNTLGSSCQPAAGEMYSSFAPLEEGEVHLMDQENMSYLSTNTLMDGQPSTNVNAAWSEPAESHVTFAHFDHDGSSDACGLRMVSVSGSAPPDRSDTKFEYQAGDVSDAFGGGKGRRFVCHFCNKTFATSQNLDVHMRIHTGERPFSCQQCGKRFTQSAHLKAHLNIHSGARPFACTVCSRTFSANYALKMHIKKCHVNG
ncbi:zinc finger protein 165-like isoform X1 [Nerophis ophidion]|uniref:zinc finger protein 165-like isoform X1 n=1 Tax=Nerophis ophidion TaxID=159077 RepID=UPI002AE01300|nr:zinc finger protein 165-like isoform X1 [Nerophis ophidion]